MDRWSVSPTIKVELVVEGITGDAEPGDSGADLAAVGQSKMPALGVDAAANHGFFLSRSVCTRYLQECV